MTQWGCRLLLFLAPCLVWFLSAFFLYSFIRQWLDHWHYLSPNKSQKCKNMTNVCLRIHPLCTAVKPANSIGNKQARQIGLKVQKTWKICSCLKTSDFLANFIPCETHVWEHVKKRKKGRWRENNKNSTASTSCSHPFLFISLIISLFSPLDARFGGNYHRGKTNS